MNAVATSIQERRRGATLNYIVSHTQLPKSTVHRLIASLTDIGYLEKTEAGGYCLGPNMVQLASLTHLNSSFTAAAHDALNRLAIISGETGFLTIRRGTIAECVLRIEGSGPIKNTVLHVGDRHPLGIGAGSLAILASLPPEEAHSVRRTNLEAFGPRSTISELERSGQLTKALKQSNIDGFSVNPGMLLPESWAIGLAISDESGKAHAALSLATIEQRLPRSRQQELATLLRDEVNRLQKHSQRLLHSEVSGE